MELKFLEDIRDNIVHYINMEAKLFDNPIFRMDFLIQRIIKLSVEKKDSEFIKKVNTYLLNIIGIDEISFNNLYLHLFTHKKNLGLLKNFLNNNRIEWSRLYELVKRIQNCSKESAKFNSNMDDDITDIHMDTIEFLIDVVYIFPNIFVDKYLINFNGNYYFKIAKIYKKISDVDINYLWEFH